MHVLPTTAKAWMVILSNFLTYRAHLQGPLAVLPVELPPSAGLPAIHRQFLEQEVGSKRMKFQTQMSWAQKQSWS